MIIRCRILPAALLIGWSIAVGAAEPSPERAMAAEAFASGDYRVAGKLYSRTREEAAKAGDDEAWMEDTVALARSRVRLGDTVGARLLLTEFSKRFPAHSTGTLPGEILVAEGRISEAEDFFRKLRDNSASGATLRSDAELALAYLQLRFGSAAQALEELTKLESDERLRRPVRLLRLYAMIRAGMSAEALKLIGSSAGEFAPPLSPVRLKLLELLAKLRSGTAAEFDDEWKKLRPELQPSPDELVFEVLDTAAKQALRSEHPEQAAAYWRDAYDFASGDEARRDALRKLFNCHAGQKAAAQAMAVALRYVKNFPDAPDRAQLLTGAGRLLVEAGDPKAALTVFKQVVDDGELLAVERRDAARDAALTAEAVGDQEAAKRYFAYFISSADTAARQQRAQILYAEYLIRRNELVEAERGLRGVAESPLRDIADTAEKLLIQVLVRRGKFSEALAEAEKLRHSGNRRSAGFGEFQAAFLTEKMGRAAEARKRYLDFIEHCGQDENVRAARYAAALLALNLGDCTAAAREFRAYAADYPGDPHVGGALFWAVRAGVSGKDAATADAAFEALKKSPGVGPEYYAAALQLTEFMRESGNPEAGLKILDGLDRSKCGDAEAATLGLMRAKLLAAAHRNAEAIREAEEVLKRYPDGPVAADAAFLAGDLRFGAGDNDKALELLSRARELRPVGVFGEAAAARLAECRVAVYQENQRPEDGQNLLRAAAEEFARLSREATVPDIRLLSKFKSGWCCEYLGETEAALDAFSEVILYAQELKRGGRVFDPKWCFRSVTEALRMLTGSDAPANARQIGTRILENAQSLGLPGGDAQFKVMRDEFEDHFNQEI